MNMNSKSNKPRPLGPSEVKIAEEAFKEALERSAETEIEMHPLLVRKIAATAVIRKALAGEDNKSRLRDEALYQIKKIMNFNQSIMLEINPIRKSIA